MGAENRQLAIAERARFEAIGGVATALFRAGGSSFGRSARAVAQAADACALQARVVRALGGRKGLGERARLEEGERAARALLVGYLGEAMVKHVVELRALRKYRSAKLDNAAHSAE